MTRYQLFFLPMDSLQAKFLHYPLTLFIFLLSTFFTPLTPLQDRDFISSTALMVRWHAGFSSFFYPPSSFRIDFVTSFSHTNFTDDENVQSFLTLPLSLPLFSPCLTSYVDLVTGHSRQSMRMS